MGRISGLVPSRFLTLLAHLVVVITLFWSRVRPTATLLPPATPFPPWGAPSPIRAHSPGPYVGGSCHPPLTPVLPRSPPLLNFLPFCPAPQDSNIQACLPLTFTPEEYEKQDIQ